MYYSSHSFQTPDVSFLSTMIPSEFYVCGGFSRPHIYITGKKDPTIVGFLTPPPPDKPGDRWEGLATV